MIVRVSSDKQYRLPDEDAKQLNDLDNLAVAAVESGDESEFRKLFNQMLELVASHGETLEDSDLAVSDVILPPANLTFLEAKQEFTGEGLIPD